MRIWIGIQPKMPDPDQLNADPQPCPPPPSGVGDPQYALNPDPGFSFEMTKFTNEKHLFLWQKIFNPQKKLNGSSPSKKNVIQNMKIELFFYYLPNVAYIEG